MSTFEINIAQRDSRGKPTNRRLEFATDSAADLADFFYKQVATERESDDNNKQLRGRSK